MANRNILLVEGPDDEHAIGQLCRRRGIRDFDEIRPHGGKDKLLKVISTNLALAEEGDTFGIIIDADSDLASSWQSIRDRIVKSGYQGVLAEPGPEGTIIPGSDEHRLPRLGIWLMPDNQTRGILEDFLQFLVPQEHRDLLEYANNCVANLPMRLFNDNDTTKAVMHTWLAWQSDPGKPYGTAINAKFLDPTVPEADVLVAWLKRLFFPGG